jgi:hypothetical protein
MTSLLIVIFGAVIVTVVAAAYLMLVLVTWTDIDHMKPSVRLRISFPRTARVVDMFRRALSRYRA